VTKSEDEVGVGADGPASEVSSDDLSDELGVVSEIDAFVAAVEAGDDLLDDDELDGVELPVVDPADSIVGALELEDGDFEELEDDPKPLALHLDIDGTVVEVDRDRFVIGRVSSLCDFALVDVNVSRQHCAIERRHAGHYLVDCGSINGVKIAGQRVDNHLLVDADVLELAGHVIRVRFAPRGALAVPEMDGSFDAVGELELESPASSQVELKTTAPYDAVSTEDLPSPAEHVRVTDPAAQSFEERTEQRLEQLSAQLDRLQESMQHLLAGFAQIQDAAAVAKLIRKRLGG
jgi:pSer/pThr/pTyr-binding forkhead associated (FHA) protein